MLHKVFPDKEKAMSIYKMALDRENSVSNLDYMKLTTIVTENYYEIIKELATSFFLLKGIKFIGEDAHKEMIDSLKKYLSFNDETISILQDLRIKRNRSMYEGKQINLSYLENNKEIFLKIIDKLKNMVNDKLK